MILANERDPILRVLRHHSKDGHIPTATCIEAAANFRIPGGLGRLLAALQRVAAIDRALERMPPGPDRDRLTEILARFGG